MVMLSSASSRQFALRVGKHASQARVTMTVARRGRGARDPVTRR